MADGEGFEPPIPFQVRQFSRLEPSTTRPPIHSRDYTEQQIAGRRKHAGGRCFLRFHDSGYKRVTFATIDSAKMNADSSLRNLSGGLENRCARKGTGGSNPSPSASINIYKSITGFESTSPVNSNTSTQSLLGPTLCTISRSDRRNRAFRAQRGSLVVS
jgi:hypothetical protein